MKIGIIIPDRGDRPKMTANILSQMDNQTFRHVGEIVIAHINFPPSSNGYDITERYHDGYDSLRNQGIDMIACIENDDWYSPNYLLEMFEQYEKMRRPDIFGIEYTYYYHLKMKYYFKYLHGDRASMMCTCLKPDIDLNWPADNWRFADMWLWTHREGWFAKRKLWNPDKVLAIGMKGHGEGVAGGTGHTNKMYRYVIPDNGFLKDNLSEDQFNFYHDFTLSSVQR